LNSQGSQIGSDQEPAPDLTSGAGDTTSQLDLASESESGSRLIGKILSPAIRLWLRVQLEAAESLLFQVKGSDRQILRGYIPTVEVAAQQAVYRGLHLSQAQLTANQIRINLGQVMQGKPLRLLEPVPVVGRVWISQTDLTASLAAPLLRQALQEVWQLLLRQIADERLSTLKADAVLQSAQILLSPEQLTLTSELVGSGQSWHLSLQATPRLLTPSCLELAALELRALPLGSLDQTNQPAQLNRPAQSPVITPLEGTPLKIAPLEIDLGRDVHLNRLVIEATQIVCEGQIAVNP
jgi:hypothetical protein